MEDASYAQKYHVYILRSVVAPDKYYVGYTVDISRRLAEHNAKSQVYSKRYAPWALITYMVFTDNERARNFEGYLKSHSGREFLNKHLI